MKFINVTLAELQDTEEKRLEAYKKGYNGGLPDLIVFGKQQPSNCNHRGIYLELKSPVGNGILSNNQQIQIQEFDKNGFHIIVSNDYNHIIKELTLFNKQVDDYIKEKDEGYCLVKKYKCSHCSHKYSYKSGLNKHIAKKHDNKKNGSN